MNEQQLPPVESPDEDHRDRVADERDARATEREAALNAREVRLDAHAARESARTEETEKILTAADERDDRADVRDQVAEERESSASLRSFLRDDEFGASLRARRAAAMDRIYSKADRTSGASDRTTLSDQAPRDPEPED